MKHDQSESINSESFRERWILKDNKGFSEDTEYFKRYYFQAK
jgi:hypothetical protein